MLPAESEFRGVVADPRQADPAVGLILPGYLTLWVIGGVGC